MNEGVTKNERKALRKREKLEQMSKAESKQTLGKWMTYGVIGLIVAWIGYAIYNNSVSVPQGEEEKPVNQVLENDWVRGKADAPVILIEYSDFQCPACLSYKDDLEALRAQFGDELAVVYRHFPLKQIHLQAELAAQAAEAAGMQGKFWEMHDALFEHHDEWAENRKAKALFINYAEEIGLDVDQFKKDLGSKLARGLVKGDFMNGLKLRINSTPTFFLNGEKLLSNPVSIDAFAELITQQLPATESAEVLE
jgi:protein-disulfide isomerase